jgi:hypothetical protein
MNRYTFVHTICDWLKLVIEATSEEEAWEFLGGMGPITYLGQTADPNLFVLQLVIEEGFMDLLIKISRN